MNAGTSTELASIRENWDGEKSLNDCVMERYNVNEADVDAQGSVWVRRAGGVGHWLANDAIIEFVAWLQAR